MLNSFQSCWPHECLHQTLFSICHCKLTSLVWYKSTLTLLPTFEWGLHAVLSPPVLLMSLVDCVTGTSTRRVSLSYTLVISVQQTLYSWGKVAVVGSIAITVLSTNCLSRSYFSLILLQIMTLTLLCPVEVFIFFYCYNLNSTQNVGITASTGSGLI